MKTYSETGNHPLNQYEFCSAHVHIYISFKITFYKCGVYVTGIDKRKNCVPNLMETASTITKTPFVKIILDKTNVTW